MNPTYARVRTKEQREHTRLLRLWATGRATRAQVLRCMELDRKATGSAS